MLTAGLSGADAPLTVAPLEAPVLAGTPVTLSARGAGPLDWDLGDGRTRKGPSITHTYDNPGVYRVVVRARGRDRSTALLLRVHTADTVKRPQVLLDTDARNEEDDQHYIAYAMLSDLDVLAINSIHHGGGQEAINYGEIHYILRLLKASYPNARPAPLVMRGADRPLEIPASGRWSDTSPVESEASAAILAAVRGAAPGNPVWVLPVGPGTNVASAILQARREGLDLKGRLRVGWLGGGPEMVDVKSFNGKNDPWSIRVLGESGIETWIVLESPTGASLRVDTRTESDLYPKNPLGKYLLSIVPPKSKALFDVATVSMVIAGHLGRHWLTEVESVVVAGPAGDYRWHNTENTSVRLVRAIDKEAMKRDFFETLNSRPTSLAAYQTPKP